MNLGEKWNIIVATDTSKIGPLPRITTGVSAHTIFRAMMAKNTVLIVTALGNKGNT